MSRKTTDRAAAPASRRVAVSSSREAAGARRETAGVGREVWMDALRILAAFLVIVNHTNSHVFQASTPAHGTWWASIIWYYISKLAVPLFVMVSGACLLPRQDSYRKAAWRAGRVLIALLVFSYGYFLHDAWVYYGLWPRSVQFGAFLELVWTQQIADSYWYLYFYIGLMLMLPLLQRLAHAMRGRDLGYLMGMCFGLSALWPLIVHYVPGLELPSYFDAPLFTAYIGLFFAGHWVRKAFVPTEKSLPGAGVALLLSLAASVLLTRLEFSRVADGANYWFMDDRMHPSILTILTSVSMMMLAKGQLSRPLPERTERVLSSLGGCTFGVYLLQDWLIAQTEDRLFLPLTNIMPAVPAVLVWELAVFAVAVLAVWWLRKLPGFRRIL